MDSSAMRGLVLGALAPSPFVDWLRERAEQEVGVAAYSTRCPLATYLRERTELFVSAYDVLDVWEAPEDADRDVTPEVIETPRWLFRFINRVDTRYGGLGQENPVTGAQALAALEDVARESGPVKYPSLAAALGLEAING